ncbi:MAG: DUF2520 domain-containing protein [Bacteroidota bacterium]|nr:DUF2520 domain-containing protein [Bacteroidota bacterium]
MPKRFPKVSIIGAGVVGTVIASTLFHKGYQFVSIIDKNGSKALSLAHAVKCDKAGVTLADLATSSDIIFITVNDSSIKQVAADLAKQKKLNYKKMLILHCSGVLSSEVLAPLEKKGALIGGMHPIQSFPLFQNTVKVKSYLKGIYYGIDGSLEATKEIQQLVENLEGKAIIIQKELKPLYHVVCVFASNYMTVFLNAIEELTRTLHLNASWTEVFGPLMTSTMENVVKTSAHKALTGPIMRGDFETIDLHLKTLNEYAPQFLSIYTIGGIEAARIAKEEGKLSDENFNEIIRKFRTFIKTSSIEKITKVKQ